MHLLTLVSGVKEITNIDNFPLESNPPQGEILITFCNGETVKLMANIDQYNEAKRLLQSKSEPSDQPRSAKAISHYLQVAYGFKIPPDELKALLDEIARHTLDVFHQQSSDGV